MFNRKDSIARIVYTKDFLNEQTLTHVTEKLNSAGLVMSASLGYGAVNGSSTVALINVGGFDDQKITCKLKYILPTTQGGEEIGVMFRVRSYDSPNNDYYYARVDGGTAKITAVNTGSFSTLTSTAFALAENQWVTITVTAIGNVLSASFEAGGSPATVSLAVVNSTIPDGGLTGFRSLGSTVFCESITVEQL